MSRAALALGALLLAGCASASARGTPPPAAETAATPRRAEEEPGPARERAAASASGERALATDAAGGEPTPAPSPSDEEPGRDLAADPYADRPGGEEPAGPRPPLAPVGFRAPDPPRPPLAASELRLPAPAAIALVCVRGGAIAPEPQAAVYALLDALSGREHEVRGVFALARPAAPEVDLEELGRQAAAERRDLLLVDVRADEDPSARARGYLLDVRGSASPDAPAPRLVGLFERGEDGLAVSSGARAPAEREGLLALLAAVYARLLEEVE